jgi:tetratricopeptide (TPR) repeat protein
MLALALSALAAAQSNAPTEPAATHSAGPYSAAALYNLGNSYARAGRPGMAVLNYERARLLAPGDADIDANIRSVRDSQRLPAETQGSIDHWARCATPTTAALLGLTGLLLVAASMAGAAWLRINTPMRVATGVVGAVLLTFTLAHGRMQWQALHSAVVIAGPSPARVSPASMAEPLFTLAEADTVRIAAEHDDFVLVRTRAGATGWVARASLMPIVPAIPGGSFSLD